ncbi:MAG: hypothetical protein JXQ73_27240 [Phycisphaerae bacterium]|nr:hypothetical protein [Phycisphaerae bacterium]
MSFADDIERFVRHEHFGVSQAADERILADAAEALRQNRITSPDTPSSSVWRKIMVSKWTKVSAAAAVVGIAAVWITTYGSSRALAAALAQTIEANRGLRYLRMHLATPQDSEGVNSWCQYDEKGNVNRFRSETCKNGWTTVWERDTYTTKHWRPDRNEFHVSLSYTCSTYNDLLHQAVRNPLFGLDLLYKLRDQGEFEIAVQQPKAEGDPIVLTATEFEWFRKPIQRYVVHLDPKTRHVLEGALYGLWQDPPVLRVRCTYSDYNVPIPVERFQLTPPEGAVVSDVTKDIGLGLADLPGKEAALKTLRAYLDAMIAKDLPAAAKVLGMQESSLRRFIERPSYLNPDRIISIGQPTPLPEEFGPGFDVSYCVEYTVDGKPVRSKPGLTVRVQPVPAKPGWWWIADIIEGR